MSLTLTSDSTDLAFTSAELVELFSALAAASNEQSILAAIMSGAKRYGAHSAQLIFLHQNAQGTPHESQVMAMWEDGKPSEVDPQLAHRHRIADQPITARGCQSATAPLFISDVEALAAADAELRSVIEASGHRAVAVLPLFAATYGGWQGLITLLWKAPHDFYAIERDFYKLLTLTLAGQIGGRRSQRDLHDTLAEMELLQAATTQLNVAVTLEEALRALLLPAPLPERAEVAMCAIENSAQGTPEWLSIIGIIAVPGEIAPQLGARYYLPDIPFAKLYLSSPDAPLLISDIENDPRVDDYARSLYKVTGSRSTLIMALTLQGRWVGLLNISWKFKVNLGDREQRLYSALAKQAALLLHNSVMVERERALLAATQQQEALLRTILDHIPIGVVLLDGENGKPLLNNAYIARMVAQNSPAEKLANDAVMPFKFVEPGTDQPVNPDDMPSRRVLVSGTMETQEVDIIRADNERVNTEATAVPIRDDSGAVKKIILLLLDMTARKRAEQDRTRLQEEIIRVQAATLAERGSPLIPITDDILVLPIIGAIDTERGHQVLDTVLHGTSQSRARVAIIDITGVRTVDTQAASALTNAAQALRLLGVEPVLTGIRPEVAQTLVGLGVRLEGITTRSTLQSGIQYALRRLGKTFLA